MSHVDKSTSRLPSGGMLCNTSNCHSTLHTEMLSTKWSTIRHHLGFNMRLKMFLWSHLQNFLRNDLHHLHDPFTNLKTQSPRTAHISSVFVSLRAHFPLLHALMHIFAGFVLYGSQDALSSRKGSPRHSIILTASICTSTTIRRTLSTTAHTLTK